MLGLRSKSPGGGARGTSSTNRPTMSVKYAGDAKTASANLFISGLPCPQVDEVPLRQLFEALGLTVMRAKVLPDNKGRGNSAAMVELASVEQATQAIQHLNGEVFP